MTNSVSIRGGSSGPLLTGDPGDVLVVAADGKSVTTAEAPSGTTAFFVVDTLTELAGIVAVDGAHAYVRSVDETYVLHSANTFAEFLPLIVRGLQGNWFKRSLAYVVGNFTLWIGGVNATHLYGVTPGQLVATATVTPDIVLDVSALLNGAQSFAVQTDLLGNLWAVFFHVNGINTLVKLALKDVLQSGAPPASVSLVITMPTQRHYVSNVAFDHRNNLWILVGAIGGIIGVESSIFKVNASEYATSGTPTPSISIAFKLSTVPPNQSSNAQYMLVDEFGNIWASCFAAPGGDPGAVVMVSSAQQQASSSALVPAVVWAGANFSGPCDLAFGPSGLLWLADFFVNTVKGFDPRAAASGNQAPSLSITSTALSGVTALAFDRDGGLWCGNETTGTLCKFAASDLISSGAKVPQVVVTLAGITLLQTITFPLNVTRAGLVPSGAPISF